MRRVSLVSSEYQRKLAWLHTVTNFESLNEKYKPVIISMIFQMGISGTLAFKHTLKAMQDDNTERVVDGIEGSKWAIQTPNRVNRLISLVRGERVREYE